MHIKLVGEEQSVTFVNVVVEGVHQIVLNWTGIVDVDLNGIMNDVVVVDVVVLVIIVDVVVVLVILVLSMGIKLLTRVVFVCLFFLFDSKI